MSSKEKPNVKTVGGSIPEDLYWAFKKAQADRHENSTQALENAIRVYLECSPENYQLLEEV